MKTILCVLVLLIGTTSLGAEQLRDAMVTELVQQAIPALTYIAGDKSWNGGMFNSGFAGSVIFDTNTSFAVYRSQEPGLSAAGSATQVRDLVLKRFAFPMAQPSSSWEKTSPGLAKGDAGEAYFVSYGKPSVPNSQRVLVSVQVVRRAATEFGVTVQYTTVTNLRP